MCVCVHACVRVWSVPVETLMCYTGIGIDMLHETMVQAIHPTQINWRCCKQSIQ